MDGRLFSFLLQPSVSGYFHKKRHLMVSSVVMILRVWVIYNRSKLILGVLLVSFSLEIIFSTTVAVIDSDPKHLAGM